MLSSTPRGASSHSSFVDFETSPSSSQLTQHATCRGALFERLSRAHTHSHSLQALRHDALAMRPFLNSDSQTSHTRVHQQTVTQMPPRPARPRNARALPPPPRTLAQRGSVPWGQPARACAGLPPLGVNRRAKGVAHLRDEALVAGDHVELNVLLTRLANRLARRRDLVALVPRLRHRHVGLVGREAAVV